MSDLIIEDCLPFAVLEFDSHRHIGALYLDTTVGEYYGNVISNPIVATKRCRHCYTQMKFTKKQVARLIKKGFQP